MSIEFVRIFGLLRAALSNSPLRLGAFATMSDEDWDSIFHISMRHDVTALVCDGILQLPQQLHPARQIMLQFIAEQEKTRSRYIKMQHALAKLLHFFNQHHISTMLLKGISLSALYPIPSHRKFLDIDIYQMGDYQQADELLQQHFKIAVHEDAHHHTKYNFDGITIENHFDFLNCHDHRSNRRYEVILKEQVSHDLRQVKLGEESLLLPSPTFNALFLMRHTTGHFAAGQISLRYLCDWYLFLQKQGKYVDWSYVTSVYQQYNMHQFVATLQGILEDYFSLPSYPNLPHSKDSKLQERVLNDILNGEFAEPEHPQENLGRLFWKIRRFQSNNWKHAITYSDSRASVFFTSLFAHLQKPRSIIHKM